MLNLLLRALRRLRPERRSAVAGRLRLTSPTAPPNPPPPHAWTWTSPTPAHVRQRRAPLRGDDAALVRPYVLASASELAAFHCACQRAQYGVR